LNRRLKIFVDFFFINALLNFFIGVRDLQKIKNLIIIVVIIYNNGSVTCISFGDDDTLVEVADMRIGDGR